MLLPIIRSQAYWYSVNQVADELNLSHDEATALAAELLRNPNLEAKQIGQHLFTTGRDLITAMRGLTA